ncbi:30S ribosomal protein S21 [Bienertia sinuspersici]
MDPKNAAEMLKHLEKQNELLDDAHKKMSHELHRLQVEQEMLMRKFYELTSTLGLNKKVYTYVLLFTYVFNCTSS